MSGSALPQLHFSDFEPQIFWLIISFFVLYILIKKVITPYFFSEIESRDAYIEESHSKVRKLQMQANHLACEYREKLGFAHDNANELIHKMKQNVSFQIEDATHKFSQENNDVFHKAYLELKQQEISVQNEMPIYLKVLLNEASDKISLMLPKEFIEVKTQEILGSAI